MSQGNGFADEGFFVSGISLGAESHSAEVSFVVRILHPLFLARQPEELDLITLRGEVTYEMQAYPIETTIDASPLRHKDQINACYRLSFRNPITDDEAGIKVAMIEYLKEISYGERHYMSPSNLLSVMADRVACLLARKEPVDIFQELPFEHDQRVLLKAIEDEWDANQEFCAVIKSSYTLRGYGGVVDVIARWNDKPVNKAMLTGQSQFNYVAVGASKPFPDYNVAAFYVIFLQVGKLC